MNQNWFIMRTFYITDSVLISQPIYVVYLSFQTKLTNYIKLYVLVTYDFGYRGVQPVARGLHAAQDDCECSSTQNHKFT